MSATQLVMILSGFPRLSETSALNEILALDEQGMLARVFATQPGDRFVHHPAVERLRNRVEILPQGSPCEQAEAIRTRLGGRRVAGVHGYFAHTPAAVAAEAGARLGVPFGFSVHAKDSRKVDPSVLVDRAKHAACVLACNVDVAADMRALGAPARLVPHGVDLDRFRPRAASASARLRILAVGRLIEKKGLPILIEAVARLAVPFRLRIVGDGPERARLVAQARASGVADSVTFVGSLSHHAITAEYWAADVVAVPSIVDSSGDRDGLPNVILEGLATGRAVVASDTGAIGSAVRDEETGLLVPPGDASALAHALERLARNAVLRARLGRNGRRLAERTFDLDQCTRRLQRLLESAYA